MNVINAKHRLQRVYLHLNMATQTTNTVRKRNDEVSVKGCLQNITQYFEVNNAHVIGGGLCPLPGVNGPLRPRIYLL